MRVRWDEFQGVGFTVSEDFTGDFGDEEVQACSNIIEISIRPVQTLVDVLTNNQTLHLILSNHFHSQCLLDPVVVFVGSSSRCHNAQF